MKALEFANKIMDELRARGNADTEIYFTCYDEGLNDDWIFSPHNKIQITGDENKLFVSIKSNFGEEK